MTSGAIDTIRAVYERWGEGDFTAGTDLFDEATVFVLRADFADAGTYLGPETLADYMRQLLEPWERFTIAQTELSQTGDTVVARVHQEGTGRSSGAVTGLDYFQLWTFRGGTVVRLENVMTAEEAAAAVGG